MNTKSIDSKRSLRIGLMASLLSALVMVGCASNVKLDEPAKVTEGTSTPVANVAQAPASATTPAAQLAAQPASAPTRQVTPVDAAPVVASTQSPPSVGKLVFFDYDSYVIKPEFQSVLDAHARYLKAGASRKVGLEGHTDERGGREYNLALGQRRAEAVARALRVLGVADNQLEAVSFGKEKPAASGNDESVWAKNRRVELFYK